MGQLLGLLGQAGSGKDTIAEIIAPVHLVEIDGQLIDIRAALKARSPVRVEKNPPERALRPRAVQVALADPLKEYARKVYDFSLEQLWGPSEERNKPDRRYPRTRSDHVIRGEAEEQFFAPGYDVPPEARTPPREILCSACGKDIGEKTCVDYLTPREALQQLGTEWGRRCYPDTWVRLAMRRAVEFTKMRIRRPGKAHTFAPNWVIDRSELVVISDCRFVNEARALNGDGHEVWRVDRPNLDKGGAMYQHASESEQVKAADEIAQYLSTIIVNDKGIDELRGLVDTQLREAGL